MSRVPGQANFHRIWTLSTCLSAFSEMHRHVLGRPAPKSFGECRDYGQKMDVPVILR
jgi:hypothetical protein